MVYAKSTQNGCFGSPQILRNEAIRQCDRGKCPKHLATLQWAGLAVLGRGRLYSIPKQYLPVPGQAVVDFGHCLLRLDAAE
jgi:hypothetical protein